MKQAFLKIRDFILYHLNNRLFVKQWIVGIGNADISSIIRTKKFICDINWISVKDRQREFADPFILDYINGEYHLLIEDISSADHYGKIALLVIDKNFRIVENKLLLDTKSHLSYPFLFKENGSIYVFPESSRSGKLSCYLYNSQERKLDFLQDIIETPLLDSTILKYAGKYWIFGVTREIENRENYELRCFYSNKLLGPYTAHSGNPLTKGLDAVRPAGNIVEVDGFLYSPTQNCKEAYGKSISINKITKLDETNFSSEFHMSVSIEGRGKKDKGMKTIHTINATNGIVVVDGIKWTFAPFAQYKRLTAGKAFLIEQRNFNS